MFEESMSIPAILASMNSWFARAVLFVLLNVMIGTIFVSSSLATSKQQQQQQQTKDDPQQQTHLHRSPSVLQRIKSIDLYRRSQEPTSASASISADTTAADTVAVTAADTVADTAADTAAVSAFIPTPLTDTHQQDEQTHEEEEEDQEGENSLDEVYSHLQEDRHVSRSVSDTKPSFGEVPVKLARKMKKSASAKSAFAHFEEDDIVETRRPATVREGRARVTEEGDDAEVDAKADDFINKFKQQLKLQRVDSIIRYKEMLTGGSGN